MRGEIRSRLRAALICVVAGYFLAAAVPAAGSDNPALTATGVLAYSYLVEDLSHPEGSGRRDRGALPIQIDIAYKSSSKSLFFARLGFASGNGLNDDNPFVVPPWAAPLEDAVHHINGSTRNNLLTAWYRYTFQFHQDNSLALTGGIVDATDYIDDNQFANDEFTQFLNGALVNGNNLFLPSYDLGAVVEWKIKRWALTGMVMEVEENEDGNPFQFYGFQAAYHLDTSLGAGNYRLIYAVTDDAFVAPGSILLESQSGAAFSADQQLGGTLGLWARIGFGSSSTESHSKHLLSGGANLKGLLRFRPDDTLGFAYAHQDRELSDVQSIDLFEVYWRVVLNETFQVTADLQYMKDVYEDGSRVEGIVYGVRLTAFF